MSCSFLLALAASQNALNTSLRLMLRFSRGDIGSPPLDFSLHFVRPLEYPPA